MALHSSLSVVIVSDYGEAVEKTWNAERAILKALADQDLAEPFAVILVENRRARDGMPEDLHRALPGLSIVFSDEWQSAKLKDHGVRRSTSEFVAVLEADCLPNRQWLRVLLDALRQRPDISIASGRTTYGDESPYRRCLTVLDRSFDNLGRAGETIHISNNGAVYRRSVLERFPYPQAATPFQSGRMRMSQMRTAGIKFWFEPGAIMRHAVGGWAFVFDFRRNTGYTDMARHSGAGVTDIPRLVWRRLRESVADCLRLGPRDLRWYDWPLLLCLLLWVRVPELLGMLDALRRRERIPHSVYR